VAQPGWNSFEHGAPGGENLADVAARANRVITKLRAAERQSANSAGPGGDVLIFAHRDILRVLAACWARLPPIEARRLYMEPTSISVLGYDHGPDEPLIRSLNT
jgi:broad specificity phosphatase PhoE